MYTASAINALVEKGMLLSYATARSLVTAKKVTKGIRAKIPLIVYTDIILSNEEDGVAKWLLAHAQPEGIHKKDL